MQQNYPFQPRGGASNTTNVVVTATAQNLTLPSVPQEGGTLRLVHLSTAASAQLAFVALVGTATAGGSMPLLPNSVNFITIPGEQVTISVIGAATASTVYATIGDGGS